MDFSRIARQLNEGESLDAAASASEKAVNGAQSAKDNNMRSKERQKAQMAQQRSTVTKSDISYASEEARVEREYDRMIRENKSDWRKDLSEALNPNDDPNHPFVDVMPFINQKQNEAKRQMKKVATGAAAHDGHHEAGDGEHSVKEGALNPFQVHFDKDGKSYKSKGSKKDGERIARNITSNRKSGPMAQDPYKPRAGESD